MVIKSATQPETRTIAAGEFKAKCLQLMDEVQKGKLTLVITKRGKAVGHLVPPPPEERIFRSVLGRSPGIETPNEAEWRERKAELAEEWERSTENLAAFLENPPSAKKRKKK